jgi:hypothetical protein
MAQPATRNLGRLSEIAQVAVRAIFRSHRLRLHRAQIVPDGPSRKRPNAAVPATVDKAACHQQPSLCGTLMGDQFAGTVPVLADSASVFVHASRSSRRVGLPRARSRSPPGFTDVVCDVRPVERSNEAPGLCSS